MKKVLFFLLPTFFVCAVYLNNYQSEKPLPFEKSHEAPLDDGIFFFGGDYLYWKATAPIVYSVKYFRPGSTVPGIFNTVSFTDSRREGTVQMKFHAGYRLHLGFYLPNAWSTSVNWTQYSGEGQDRATTNGHGGTVITLNGNFWQQVGITDLASIPEDAYANQRVRLKFLDFLLTKNLFLYSQFHFHPFVGLRGAIIKNDMRMDYRGLNTNVNIFAKDHIDLNNHYRSAGIILGFKTSWIIAGGLEFFNDLAVSGLYGEFNLRKREEGTRINSTDPIFVPFVIDSDNKKREAKYGIQLSTGIKYGNQLIAQNKYVGFQLGYEIGLFPNQIRIYFPNSEAFESGYDLTYHGLTASVKLDY